MSAKRPMKSAKTPSEAPRRALGYVRVSTEHQAQEGVSLAEQEARIRAYCVALGLELVGVEVDAGESAATLSRPGLTRALEALRDGKADVLVVTKLDRLTRSIRDLDALLAGPLRSGALISIGEQFDTGTATGRLVLNVLASVGQWEREIIGERIRAALAHKRSLGQNIGQVPYGFRLGPDGVHLEEDPDEQAVIGRIRDLRRQGMSYRSLVSWLNANERPRGRVWAKDTVYRLARE